MLSLLKKARHIHIVGISGTEGAAVALFLAKLQIPFTGHDFSTEAKFKRNFSATHLGLSARKREKMFARLWALRGQIHFEPEYLRGIKQADLIFVSQNWEAYAPNRKLQKIYGKNSSKFITITQLYFNLFPGRILAVTGTNGKSTTTKLIAEIMQKSRQKSWFTGNDRRNVQILDCLDKWRKSDWLVVEVSNRQLKFNLDRAPDIGIITNITRNHLPEYGGSFAKYKAGKYGLIKRQTKSHTAILNHDNPVTRALLKKVPGTPLPFSVTAKLHHGVYIDNGWIVYRDKKITKVLPVDKIRMSGRHNLSNICAAIAAVRIAGVDWATIRTTVSTFRGLPQRLELVISRRGVRFINDTASTTPESTIAALKSFPTGSVHLICGGDAKGMDYKTLAGVIQRQQACSVTLLKSPAATKLATSLKMAKTDFKIVNNLPEALRSLEIGAERYVLLSPAANYFNYFKGKIPLGGRGFELFIRQLEQPENNYHRSGAHRK